MSVKVPGRWHAIMVTLSVLMALGGLVEFIVAQEMARQKEVELRRLADKAGELRAALDAELNATLHLANGLASYIRAREGIIDTRELEPWMTGLIEHARHIRNIGVAPGNRLTYVYPRSGNEAAIGLYYPDVPTQWPGVLRTIRERRSILVGPILLKQGGQGIIYRTPVFLNDNTYWGQISTVIDVSRLVGGVQALARERGLRIALSLDKEGADTVFWGEGGRQHALVLTMEVPGGRWRMRVDPVSAERSFQAGVWRIAGWSITGLLALAAGMLRQGQQKQRQMWHAWQASHARFVHVFDRAPIPMALIDRRGRWNAVNRAMEVLMGGGMDVLQHAPVLHRVHASTAPLLTRAFDELAEGRVSFQDFEGEFLDALGERVDVQISVSFGKTLLEPGEGYILQLQDIRERKRHERLKEEFISTVSHELRTPLTSIGGALGLVRAGVFGTLPVQAAELMEVAYQSSQRLGVLINDLLDMEKLASGQMRFVMEVQPLEALVARAIEEQRAFAQQHGVLLRTDSRDDRMLVNVDGLRVIQVMANLLSNAIKYSPAGATVRVTLRQQRGNAIIRVMDEGPGIPLEFRDRIFQKFSQADSSDTRQKGGTGLGLAISRELVERMHGRISYESEPGKGTVFWVEWPLAHSG